MRIVAFGDIHMAVNNCRNIKKIGEADLIILTGDLTNYGDRADAREVLDLVMTCNPNVLALFGNLDAPEINDYLEDQDLNLHGQARLVQGKLCLIGVGGSNPTPFLTPSEFSEEELMAIANRAQRQAAELVALAEPLNRCRIPTILVSHPPPLNTVTDRLLNGSHVGSSSIRAFIETHQPDLCICGHIHEAKGEDLIGRTPVLNPGMLKDGGWIEITLENSMLRAMIQ